ncbi:MAG: hypothetical protein AB7P03_29260 [Kofleriaceae bacterium]
MTMTDVLGRRSMSSWTRCQASTFSPFVVGCGRRPLTELHEMTSGETRQQTLWVRVPLPDLGVLRSRASCELPFVDDDDAGRRMPLPDLSFDLGDCELDAARDRTEW